VHIVSFLLPVSMSCMCIITLMDRQVFLASVTLPHRQPPNLKQLFFFRNNHSRKGHSFTHREPIIQSCDDMWNLPEATLVSRDRRGGLYSQGISLL
jgi:hypothetical protein